jgi:hypothetical protein
MRLNVAGLLLLLMAAPAWADGPSGAKADVSTFAESKAQIEADLKKGERYSELSASQRDEVRAALERMENRLQGVTSVAEMDARDRAELMNDQELVNTILTAAEEDSRLICKRTVKTGSHRPTTSCRTVAERRRERENSQQALRSMQKSHMDGPGD